MTVLASEACDFMTSKPVLSSVFHSALETVSSSEGVLTTR